MSYVFRAIGALAEQEAGLGSDFDRVMSKLAIVEALTDPEELGRVAALNAIVLADAVDHDALKAAERGWMHGVVTGAQAERFRVADLAAERLAVEGYRTRAQGLIADADWRTIAVLYAKAAQLEEVLDSGR